MKRMDRVRKEEKERNKKREENEKAKYNLGNEEEKNFS